MLLRINKVKTPQNSLDIKFFNQEVRIMDIKVLGPGCAKCQQTEKVVKEAVAEAGVDATVGHVTDTMELPATVFSVRRLLLLTVKSKVSAKSQKKKMLSPGLPNNIALRLILALF
jgi:hypothetical protein